MKVVELKINNYKSIKESQSINFKSDFLTILGENGSGKTNFLRAIQLFFDKRNIYHDFFNTEYNATIELEDSEVTKYNDEIKIDAETKTINAYYRPQHNNEPEVKRIKSKLFNVTVKKEKEELQRLQKEIESALNEYVKQLKILEYEIANNSTPSGIVTITQGSDTHFSPHYEFRADNIISNVASTLASLKQHIDENFSEEEFNISDDKYLNRLSQLHNIDLVEIRKSDLVALSFLEKCGAVTIDNEKYNKIINDLNEKLKSHYNRAICAIEKFKVVVENAFSLVEKAENQRYNYIETRKEKYNSFILSIKRILSSNCWYLDSEQPLLFTTRNESDHYHQNQQYYLNGNPILNSLDKYCKENALYQDDESILEYKKISKQQINILLKSANKFFDTIVPKFDNGKIEKIYCTIDEKGNLDIKVKELHQDEISLSHSSLGRRWYFTYQFIKANLKPGDIFFIDEPASSLHPSAQQELLHDLVELSKYNKIIITTHSPFMIDLENANFLEATITENGTAVSQIQSSNILNVHDAIGLDNLTNLFFNSDKTYILVEGKTDATLIEKLMPHLGIDKNKYNIFPCDGYGIATVDKFLEANGREFVGIIDADHKGEISKAAIKEKYKTDKARAKLLCGMRYYIDFISKANRCSKKYAFVGSSDQQEIEGLLSKVDQKNCCIIRNGKQHLSSEQTRKTNNFEQETLDNFKDVFLQLGILQTN